MEVDEKWWKGRKIVAFLWFLLVFGAPGNCLAEGNAGYTIHGFLSVEEGAVTTARQPEILFVFEGTTPPGLSTQFVLDGIAVSTSYDSTSKVARAVPVQPLTLGPHVVTCNFMVEGQRSAELTSHFMVVAGLRSQLPSDNDEQVAVAAVNVIRAKLGLPALEFDVHLEMSAQNHSNYVFLNKEFAHTELMGKQGYTGAILKQRTDYTGFFGLLVAETGTEESGSLPAGIDRLSDAPYHRMEFVNPNLAKVGVGFNRESGQATGNIFINYGNSRQANDDNRIILYPYPGEADVKIGWQDNEWPDPLRFFPKSQNAVGYPISISVHDKQTIELQALHVELSDDKGRLVPIELVDSSRETDASEKKHIFVIPTNVLQPGASYHIVVQALRVLKNGQQTPLDLKWTFITNGQLTVKYAEYLTIANRDFIKVYAENGDFPDFSYVLMSGSSIVRTFTKGNYYDQTGQPLSPGYYRLEVHSDLFGQSKVYDLQLFGNPEQMKVALRESTDSPKTDFSHLGL